MLEQPDGSMQATKGTRLIALRALSGNPFGVPPLAIVPPGVLGGFFDAHPRHCAASTALFRRVDRAIARGEPGPLLRIDPAARRALVADLRSYLACKLEPLDALAAPWNASHYAVRSSGFEDGDVATQAGAFISRLGVTRRELPDAVAEVIASYLDPRRYRQLAMLAGRLEPAGVGRLRAELRRWVRGAPASFQVIVQAMFGNHDASELDTAPVLSREVVDLLRDRAAMLDQVCGFTSESEWVWCTGGVVRSIVALSTDDALPVAALHIAAAAGAGAAVTGRSARATSVIVPRDAPSTAYVRGEPFGIADRGQLALVQVRPAIAVRSSRFRIDVERARRGGCQVLEGESLVPGRASGPGHAIAAASLDGALRIYLDHAIDPRRACAGVAVLRGSPLDHPAIVFRQLGVPVIRLPAPAFSVAQREIAAGAKALVASEPPALVVARAVCALHEAAAPAEAARDWLAGAMPDPAPPAPPAVRGDRVTAELARLDAERRTLLALLDSGDRARAALRAHLQALRSGSPVMAWWCAVLDDVMARAWPPQLVIAELARLLGAGGLRAQLVAISDAGARTEAAPGPPAPGARLLERCGRDPFTLPGARDALRAWLTSRDAGALVPLVEFHYEYAPPDAFKDRLRSILHAAGEAAPPALDVASPRQVERARAALDDQRLPDDLPALLDGLGRQFAWLVEIDRPSAANLFEDLVDLHDRAGKVLALELAAGRDGAFDAYWRHLARWHQALAEFLRGHGRPLDRSNLDYVGRELDLVAQTGDDDLALPFRCSWRERLRDQTSPVNLHELHNSLHQGALAARRHLLPLEPSGLAARLHALANAFRVRENPITQLRPDRVEIDLGLTVHKAIASLTTTGWRIEFTEPPGSPYTPRGRIGRIVLLEGLMPHLARRLPGIEIGSRTSFALGDASIEITARSAAGQGGVLDEELALHVFLEVVTLFDASYHLSGEPIARVEHVVAASGASTVYRRVLDALPGYRRHLDYAGYQPRPGKNLFAVALSCLCLDRAYFDFLDACVLDDLATLADATRRYLIKHRRPPRCREARLACLLAALWFPDQAVAAAFADDAPLSRADLARHVLARGDIAARARVLVEATGRTASWARLWQANPWYAARTALADAELRARDLPRFLATPLSPCAEVCFVGYLLPDLVALCRSRGELGARARARLSAFLAGRAAAGYIAVSPYTHEVLGDPEAWRGISALRLRYTALSQRDIRYLEPTPLASSPPAPRRSATLDESHVW
jgi:hypothetical protein